MSLEQGQCVEVSPPHTHTYTEVKIIWGKNLKCRRFVLLEFTTRYRISRSQEFERTPMYINHLASLAKRQRHSAIVKYIILQFSAMHLITTFHVIPSIY